MILTGVSNSPSSSSSSASSRYWSMSSSTSASSLFELFWLHPDCRFTLIPRCTYKVLIDCGGVHKLKSILRAQTTTNSSIYYYRCTNLTDARRSVHHLNHYPYVRTLLSWLCRLPPWLGRRSCSFTACMISRPRLTSQMFFVSESDSSSSEYM